MLTARRKVRLSNSVSAGARSSHAASHEDGMSSKPSISVSKPPEAQESHADDSRTPAAFQPAFSLGVPSGRPHVHTSYVLARAGAASIPTDARPMTIAAIRARMAPLLSL